MTTRDDRILTIAVMVLSLAAPPAHADWQSPESIQATAVELVRSDQEDSAASLAIRAATPDARLRLARCEQPLDASYLGKRTGTRMTIRVACGGSLPWKIYVPVTVTRFQRVVVTTRHLQRGHTLVANDLDYQRRDVTDERMQYVTSIDAVIGQRTTKTVIAGAPLTARVVSPPNSVESGRIVTLTAKRAGIVIRMAGTALDSAALGESVRVRNDSSGRIVEGVVSASNEVLVTSF
ncbi:MAG: flagellar basal body P-ring formation chaperone FlgA [Pseudomonadota bacterium]